MSHRVIAPLDLLKQRDLRDRLTTRHYPRPIESLEPRRLFAVTFADATMTITGTSGNDTITMLRTGPQQLTVTVNGQATIVDLNSTEFRDLEVFAMAGNDTVTIGNDTAGDDTECVATIHGGDGNDTLTGGDSWITNYDAGDGDDLVNAGPVENGATLGIGDDTYFGGTGPDQVFAGDGNDSVAGNGGDDDLLGDDGDDIVDGGDGNDQVTGWAGNDTVIGGAGFDVVDGGDGIDSVVGDANDDALFNGENAGGDDDSVFLDAGGILRIVGTPGKDLVDALDDAGFIRIEFGDAIKRFAKGDVNAVHADLGAGNDSISLRQSNAFSLPATLLGGDGNDNLSGGAANDVISGGDGDDELWGSLGNDQITGDAGDDTLDGGDGTDTLSGGAGFNAFFSGETTSGGTFLPGLSLVDRSGFPKLRFDGTDADDEVTISRISEVRYAVSINGAQQTVGLIGEIELLGNGGNDDLRIDASLAGFPSTTLNGGAGNDTLSGGSGGNERLFGGAGDDLLLGNVGEDFLSGEGGNDTLDGGAGEDTLDGGAGEDTLMRGEINRPGPAELTVEDATLTFNGSAGAEQVSIWSDSAGGLVIWVDGEADVLHRTSVTGIALNGRDGNDLLKLNPGLNIPATLNGDAGDDTLIGGAAGDGLAGGNGNDHLAGNAGNDELDGGFGGDTMLGGAGKDTADYSSRGANLVVGLDAFTDDGEAGELDLAYLDIERVLGGRGNDRIGGSASNNELYGNDGNDTLSGGGSADALFGAAGNDKMDGGDGSDYLEGGAGHDTLYGGAGGDTMFGLAGNDRLLSDGDGEKDIVRGGEGTDSGDSDDLDDVSGIEIALA